MCYNDGNADSKKMKRLHEPACLSAQSQLRMIHQNNKRPDAISISIVSYESTFYLIGRFWYEKSISGVADAVHDQLREGEQ